MAATMDEKNADNAPVVHVLFTVSFTPAVDLLTVIDLANLYRRFEAEFPVFQQLHRAGPMQAYPSSSPAYTGGQSVVFNQSNSPRVSFTSADQSLFIFFQDDRFSFGWMRTAPPGDPCGYPGFNAVFERFQSNLTAVIAWLAERGFNVHPQVGELVYTDAFDVEFEEPAKVLAKTFSIIQPMSQFPLDSVNLAWIEAAPANERGYASVKVYGPGPSVVGTQVVMLETTVNFDVSDVPWKGIPAGYNMAHGVAHDVFRRVVNPSARATL